METVIVQIKNHCAFNFLENLETLNVIKVLRRIPYSKSERTEPVINEYSDRAARLSEIQSITESVRIDLTNFQFNRDEANNYDA